MLTIIILLFLLHGNKKANGGAYGLSQKQCGALSIYA
jgi:hypothetical protein